MLVKISYYLLISLLFCEHVKASNIEKDLRYGNAAMKEENYQTACNHYLQSIASGLNNATAHFNAGVCSYRLEQFGAAIFHFKVADLLKPANPDILFNLEFARKKTKDKIEARPLPIFLKPLRHWPLNLKWSMWLTAGLCLFFSVILSILLFWEHTFLFFLRNSILVLLFISCMGMGFRYFIHKPFGVITEAKVDVYSGMSSSNVLLFSLREGSEFVILNESEDWLRIELEDGKCGWIRKEQALWIPAI